MYIDTCSGHNMNITIITTTIVMKCIHIHVLVITWILLLLKKLNDNDMYIYTCSGHNMNITIIRKFSDNEMSIYTCSGHNMNITIITTSIIMKCLYIHVLVITWILLLSQLQW